jgi:hypothetical protein
MWLIKNTHHRRRGLRTALVGMSPLEFWGGDTVKKQVHHQATGSTSEIKEVWILGEKNDGLGFREKAERVFF